MAAAAQPIIEREVVRCANCLLRQFMTRDELCRRCHAALRPQMVKPRPALTVVQRVKAMVWGKRPTLADLPLSDQDIAMDEVLRTAPSMAQGARRPTSLHIRTDLAVLVLRVNAGLSQRQLAEKMDCSRTYITKIESGTTLPTLANLDRLAAGLGVSPYQLVMLATL
jgi:ribosome-binding protein aMBF1 (putative translation factor)